LESVLRVSASQDVKYKKREEAAMPTCPECENNLDVEVDELEEGDVVACEECGSEYEVVGVEPLELSRVGDEDDEDEDEYLDEEEEEEE
jgi:alpha-aminoadipate carrier protein LysW